MYEKKAGARDESLDCEVYAYAALHLGPVSASALQAEWERVMAEGDAMRTPKTEATAAPPRPARPAGTWLPRRGKGWL